MRRACWALVCLGPMLCAWTDPVADTHESATPPALDVVDLTVIVRPETVDFFVHLNPDTTLPGDADQLSGFIDLDTDHDLETGSPSHLEQFGWEPFPPIGADFFVTLYAWGDAEVSRLDSGIPTTVGTYPISRSEFGVSWTVPRCYAGPVTSPACITAPMDVVALIGNGDGMPTDRIPNDDAALTASWRCDFDLNGLVDADDLGHLSGCRSGSKVPQPLPACQDADLDGDGDVDLDDFGLFQRCWGAQ